MVAMAMQREKHPIRNAIARLTLLATLGLTPSTCATQPTPQEVGTVFVTPTLSEHIYSGLTLKDILESDGTSSWNNFPAANTYFIIKDVGLYRDISLDINGIQANKNSQFQSYDLHGYHMKDSHGVNFTDVYVKVFKSPDGSIKSQGLADHDQWLAYQSRFGFQNGQNVSGFQAIVVSNPLPDAPNKLICIINAVIKN